MTDRPGQPETDTARRHWLRSLAGWALVPWLAGCEHAPAKPLVIASHVWPGYELMFLARQEGWLPPESRLHLLETDSATASLAALANGLADGAALTLDEVLRARADGMALTIVLVFDVSAGADMLLARPGIRTLADLAGRRIGVEQNALGALMLYKILDAAGLPVSAVTAVPMAVSGHLEAWRGRYLDALITYEPTASRVLADGAHRLFDSRKMPETIFDVLAIKPQALAHHPGALAALVAGHFRALRHFQHNPQDAVYRMAGRLGIPASEVLDAYGGLLIPDLSANRQYLSHTDTRLSMAATELSKVMHQAGLLGRVPELADLAKPDFLPETP